MPNLPASFSAYPVSVTLDGSGNGAVRFQAVGSNIRITNRSVRVDSANAQALATTYKGQVGDNYRLDGTNSGSTGDNISNPVDLFDGEAIIVVWSGGDPGATATATFSGKRLPFDEVGKGEGGNNWSSPVAAGDGSLIYPAIKSPNFVTGIAGWNISRDGSAEFASGIFRGELLIVGPDREVDITTGGVYVTDLTAPGAEIQLTTAPAFGGALVITPQDSTVAGVSFQAARIYAGRVDNGGVSSTPYVRVGSPQVQAAPLKAASQTRWYGQESGTTDSNSYIEHTATQIYVNSLAVGLGWIGGNSVTVNSAAIGNSETAIMTLPSLVFKAGHAYRMEAIMQFSLSAAPNRPVFRLRENYASAASPGVELGVTGKPGVVVGMEDGSHIMKFVNSTSTDITKALTLTATSQSAGFTVTALGSPVFTADVYDIGAASNHPNSVSLV